MGKMSYLWGSEERDPRAYAAYCVWRGCAVCWAREAGVAPMGAARGARVARGARGTSLAVSAKRCGWSGGGKWAPPRKDRRRGASRSRMPARTRARAHAAGGQPLSSPPEPGLKSCSLLEQRRNANRRAKKEAGEGAEEADDEVAGCAAAMKDTKLDQPPPPPEDPKDAINKQIKKVQKKIRQIHELQSKVDKGDVTPNDEEKTKLGKLKEFEAEVASLEKQLAAM
eukprot:Tamp_20039.p1 GENE.Tamp_20039~~Tamp_20039.p1  ORF type:complete len:226 (+),score=48.79 Tamp_20039:535-1212(+)